jgi:hypothetical protein
VRLDKRQLVELFLRSGRFDLAEAADQSLPALIDPREHSEALRALGIDAGLLLTSADNLEVESPGSDLAEADRAETDPSS